MPSALDTFRAQREAADGVYARLKSLNSSTNYAGRLMRWRARRAARGYPAGAELARPGAAHD